MHIKLKHPRRQLQTNPWKFADSSGRICCMCTMRMPGDHRHRVNLEHLHLGAARLIPEVVHYRCDCCEKYSLHEIRTFASQMFTVLGQSLCHMLSWRMSHIRPFGLYLFIWPSLKLCILRSSDKVVIKTDTRFRLTRGNCINTPQNTTCRS
jgi:hypothetical protein